MLDGIVYFILLCCNKEPWSQKLVKASFMVEPWPQPRNEDGLHWLEDPRIPLKWAEVANEHANNHANKHHLMIA